MVPTLLSSSVSVLSQSIYVVFGTVLLIQLENNGTLSEINSALASRAVTSLQTILLSPKVLDLVALYLGCAFVLSTVVSFMADGFAYSSEYGSYITTLRGAPLNIIGVLSFLKSRWRKMAWTEFLVELFSYLPLGLLFLFFASSMLTSGPNLFSLVALSGVALIGLVLTAVAEFFLMYALIIVATENLSGLSALTKSYQVASGNFGISMTYAIVRALSLAVISIIGALSSTLGVPLSSLASIAITLLLVPVLHLSKTEIYLQTRQQSNEELLVYGPTSAQRDLFSGAFVRFVLRKLRMGISQLGRFVFSLRNLPYHLGSVLFFALGVLVGSFIATHGLTEAILSLGYAPGRINPTLLGDVPLTGGLDIFFHNWLVSMTTALSGMWLVAPSLLALFFNGLILGAVYYLTPNATMFAAAILPHGSIEIPSFILAGSAGMRLGVAFIRGLCKEDSRFQAVAKETVYIVIGLAVLFLVAGLIEGSITPIIMKQYGWK